MCGVVFLSIYRVYLISSAVIICSNKQKLFKQLSYKGTVSVILSDPPCKDDNARFTMIHLNRYVNNKWKINIGVFKF